MRRKQHRLQQTEVSNEIGFISWRGKFDHIMSGAGWKRSVKKTQFVCNTYFTDLKSLFSFFLSLLLISASRLWKQTSSFRLWSRITIIYQVPHMILKVSFGTSHIKVYGFFSSWPCAFNCNAFLCSQDLQAATQSSALSKDKLKSWTVPQPRL